MKLVYICSPLRGDIKRNVANAIRYCLFATTQDVIPFAPHAFFTPFLDDRIEAHRMKGMAMGLDMLERCSELWAFGKYVSSGMKAEIDLAIELGIPVLFYSDRCKKRLEVGGE